MALDAGEGVRVGTALGLSVVLLAGGCLAGLLFTVGCSENLHPHTRREGVCSTVADGTAEIWLAMLWPVVLYAATWLIPGLRRRVGAVGLVIAALGVVFWAPLLAMGGSG